MGDMQELIEKPLSSDELAVRYRALCNDPRYANVPGKIELDAEEVWIVYPKSRRCEFYGQLGRLPASRYAVDLADIFS